MHQTMAPERDQRTAADYRTRISTRGGSIDDDRSPSNPVVAGPNRASQDENIHPLLRSGRQMTSTGENEFRRGSSSHQEHPEDVNRDHSFPRSSQRGHKNHGRSLGIGRASSTSGNSESQLRVTSREQRNTVEPSSSHPRTNGRQHRRPERPVVHTPILDENSATDDPRRMEEGD